MTRTEIEGDARGCAPERGSDRVGTLPPTEQCAYGLDAPLASEYLLRGRREIAISHNGAIYRLRATRLGKLILTK
ncbi:MAG TPA: hemin uptake protein HemP [Ottowia sp.]|uniref:hemin uptake protein HemP n=1 Tax=Ottowia sp. TaxID=1898956 RepID=UPI002C36F13C|nr:hemin uptake protein HemP [Ottowia sp.]HMN21252.1 hemin uptake protein HemP [Ottowia sp.]